MSQFTVWCWRFRLWQQSGKLQGEVNWICTLADLREQNKNNISGFASRSTVCEEKMLFTVWGVHTEIKTKTQPSFFLVSCLSAFGPGSQTRCQFLVLISMFSAVLTDGETPGWPPSKGVINRTREAAASALTPCRGCLPGPRSWGQCLPFTPRYSCSLPWPFPAGKHAPHETASQSVPLLHPAPPFTTRHSLFPLPK